MFSIAWWRADWAVRSPAPRRKARVIPSGLAREFGPVGVHVVHLVLDGLMDEVQTEQRFGTSSSARMSPQAIAQACLALSAQHPSAWTHEMDLRPFSERF